MKNYTCILLHYILVVKESSHVLTTEAMRKLLFDTVHKIGETQKFKVICVGGYVDHLHFVVELGKNQKSARIAHTVQDLTAEFFRKEYGLELNWQEAFTTVSIGNNQLAEVSEYIKHNDCYHKDKSYAEEYAELIAN